MTPISHTAALSQVAPQKARHASQTPGFMLRTVRPATPQSIEKRLRPDPQHVPGSYLSEFDRSIDSRSVVAAPSGSEYSSMPENGNAFATQLYYDPHATLPQGAVEALTKTISHDTAFAANRSVRSISSRPSLRERLSTATLSSRKSAKQLHHPLSKPAADSFITSMPIEPVLTSDIDQLHEHGITKMPLHVVDVRHHVDHPADLEPALGNQKNQSSDQWDEDRGESTNTIVELNGPPLSEVLADLPPLRQEAVWEFGVENVARSPLSSSERASHKRSTSLHRSPKFPLDLEGTGAVVQQSPGLGEPEAVGHSDSRGHDSTAQMRNPLPRSDAEASSTDSNFISVSSGNSSQGEARTFSDHKSTKSGRNHILNGTHDLQKFPSLLPSGASVITHETTDNPGLPRDLRLLHEKPYQAQNDLREAQETQQPKLGEYLLRRLLGRRNTPPDVRNPSTLTARPYHRQRSMADAVQRDRNSPDSDSTPSLRQPNVDNDSFNQAIRDLEELLQEAILVARQAADQDQSGPIKQRPTRSSESDRSFIVPSSPDKEQNQDSVASEKIWPGRDHIIILESAETEMYPKSFKKTRDATPYPTGSVVATRHPSANPGYYYADEPPGGGGEVLKVTLPISQQSPELRRPSYTPQLEPLNTSSNDATESIDWAPRTSSARDSNPEAVMSELSVNPRKPSPLQTSTGEQLVHVVRESKLQPNMSSNDKIQSTLDTAGDYGPLHSSPPIQPRSGSAMLQPITFPADRARPYYTMKNRPPEQAYEGDAGTLDWRDPSLQTPMGTNTRATGKGEGHGQSIPLSDMGPPRQDTIMSMEALEPQTQDQETIAEKKSYDLRNRHHSSIREHHGFSLSRSHRRAPIARDWSTSRKRFVAAVACINTALLGLIVGIYAGEVPAIQYAIVDEHHYVILGNVVFYAGLAIPTALLWPLPLLYGRKPFILAGLALLIALQFPQGIVVGTTRSPYVATYRTGLLVARAISGLVMGFANINFLATLLDLFGASLQSGNPHQEVVDENDVRRHGGGMGVWLGIWTWCFIGSIGVGFLFGALVISGVNVSWGFYIVVILIAIVLLLNIITPEVRRSPYRRSIAEVRTGSDISRRIARGEVKMHLQSTGPKWWWEEVVAGNVLCLRMVKQPAFFLLALYLGWIYGQVILVIVLLGALTSKYYKFHPQYVGLCVLAISIGAFLAIPFQKASLFSRSRHHAPRTDSMTFEKRVTWTSHLVRRAIFMIVLPFAGLAYTLASGGTQIHFMVPTVFAGLIGFLSNLAIAECNGIIMETYDTSDLQPGMTGRPREVLPEEIRKKRTNYSAFPRVSAAVAITQTFAFIIAAAATGTGGAIERRLGAQTATAVVAGILLILTLLLIAVLTRFKVSQVVPTQRYGTNVLSGPEDEWKPVIIGHPSGTTRRMSWLELGKMSRWHEIRRRNRFTGLEQQE
ncbi:Major facilitator superfamily domain, general substrate transporter [Lasallia pustulata]|uniref:Major facilitator superfamily domain, general substrate transporter n=1 Tax=Lasallia pustulata TaxID=136370 RepID=A0A1W5D1E6_9LECA|nr:Major facilitator superfamily domain, general substrate transporter [Lasallia pustulata]